MRARRRAPISSLTMPFVPASPLTVRRRRLVPSTHARPRLAQMGPCHVGAHGKAPPWLRAAGSLTARLRHLGEVKVLRLHQGRQRLLPMEASILGQGVAHVREVLLCVNGQPAVWARSATSLAAVKGPWKALRGLGTRPLAELLFARRHVQRLGPFAWHLPARGAWPHHLRRQWPLALAQLRQQPLGSAGAHPGATDGLGGRDLGVGPGLRALAQGPRPRWARRSLFRQHGQDLLVVECMSPWVLQQLSAQAWHRCRVDAPRD